MKTAFRSVLALGIAALLFASCEKEVKNSEVKLDESKTATVELYVGAQLDLQKQATTGIWQDVPAGKAKAIFTATMDNFGDKSATPKIIEVAISGPAVKVELPTVEKGVQWTIDFTNFTATQRNGTGSDVDDDGTPLVKKFSAGQQKVTLLPGDYKILTVVYLASEVQPKPGASGE